MGAKCCSDRKEVAKEGEDATQKLANKPAEATAGYTGTPTTHGGGGKKKISLGYHAKGDDAEQFDKAFESNDLAMFVKLLSSTQPIESFDERMHPWAQDPKTVGALAGTQLAILASTAEKENPAVKDDIRSAGAIPPLVGFLRSGEEDRIQTAVVSLSFLSAENRENCVQIYKAGAMPLLMPHLESQIDGMRAATAATLRNIFIENEDYRKEFVDMGGIGPLVRQLETKPGKPDDPAGSHLDVQLEAILNLQDLIEDDQGGIKVEYAQAAIEAGAEDLLRVLSNFEDEDISSSASEVLASLSSVKGK